MNRQESLRKEHESRVGNVRLDSALPPGGVFKRRSYPQIILLVILLLVLAGLLGWHFYGGM